MYFGTKAVPLFLDYSVDRDQKICLIRPPDVSFVLQKVSYSVAVV